MLLDERFAEPQQMLSVAAASLVIAAAASASASTSLDTIVHYAPDFTEINNLYFVINGTGAPGIFNSSTTPDASYGEYNWCNMPHVRAKEYPVPSSEYTLEYVEVLQRHHKRTPYSSNTFFKEDIPWNCDSEGPLYYAKDYTSSEGEDVAPISWTAYTPSHNPFSSTVGPGFVNSTCQLPQITADGLKDSHQHGLDLRGVYHNTLNFLPSKLDTSKIAFRVTNNQITSQVLGGLITGLFPETKDYAAFIQSDAYDSLEPAYSCALADTIKTAYTTDSANWTEHLTLAAPLYAKLDEVSGTANATEDTAGWHTSLDHYYDNLSAKLCHQKSLPCSVNDTAFCVSQTEADEVFRLGNYEYSFYYRDAVNSTLYSALHYGAFFLELKSHLQAKIAGTSSMKYLHNVAHDGSVAPALGVLQASKMVWPGMGSEIVFELWKKASDFKIRVLWGGQPLETSTPLGTLDMVSVDDFLLYINTTVPSNLPELCILSA